MFPPANQNLYLGNFREAVTGHIILAIRKLMMTGRFAPLLFRESVLRVKGERKGVQEGGQPTT